jgi:hypothetical protein
MGSEARRTIEQRYTDDRIARMTIEVYQRCLKNGS